MFKGPLFKTWLSVFVVLVFALSSCAYFRQLTKKKKGPIKSPGGFTRYADEFENISIEFPNDWEVTVRPDQDAEKVKPYLTLVFTAKSPLTKKDKFQEKIGVVVVDLAHMEYSKARTEKRRSDASHISKAGFTQIAGEVAQWHVSRAYKAEDEETDIKQMGFDITKDTKLYKIGWVGESGELAKQKDLINRVAHSLKIEYTQRPK